MFGGRDIRGYQYSGRMDSPTVPHNPALAPLAVFGGEWTWEASLEGRPFGRGRAVFEWLEGGAFLLQRDEAEQPEFPASTVIVGADDTTGAYCWLHFDSRAVSRIYRMSLEDGVWRVWREAPGFSQWFAGTFSRGGTLIRGRWEKSGDGRAWDTDFDLTYTRRT